VHSLPPLGEGIEGRLSAVASTETSSLRKVLRLLGYARPYAWLVVLSILASLAYAAGDTGRSYLLRPVLDGVLLPAVQADGLEGSLESLRGQHSAPDPGQAEEERKAVLEGVLPELKRIVVWAILIVLGMPLVRLARDFISEWVMIRLLVDLQLRLGTRLLDLPLSRYQSVGRGDFVARMTSDAMLANSAQSLIFGESVQAVAILLTSLSVAFYLSWQLTLISLLVAPGVGLVFQIFGSRIRKSSRARQEQISEVVQRLIQVTSGMKIIKAFSAEGQERTHLSQELMRYFRRAMRVIRNRVYSRTLVEFLGQLVFFSLMLVGIFAIARQTWGLTLGTLAAYLFIVARLQQPVKLLTRTYNSIQDALPAADRLFEIIDADGEEPDAPDAVELQRLEQGIRYRDVAFSYGREPVLGGVNLEIGAGEVVALVGRTGAGKTTLADLLLRFVEPDRGSVELDGIDLRKVQRRSLRHFVAVVTQEPFLFDSTILRNIRYGRPDASLEDVVEAARAANIHEFIDSLPEQYETRVGDLGTKLSGGQRQRITIARAILRNPEILIFDEATSALDAKAEQQVKEAIWNLMKGRTVLLIAHRLSTVKAADRIAVLEDGRITMIGTHEELIARGGLYRELVQLQFATPPHSA
jgi:subfamily B ATP-binding cassette protein MsbA